MINYLQQNKATEERMENFNVRCRAKELAPKYQISVTKPKNECCTANTLTKDIL